MVAGGRGIERADVGASSVVKPEDVGCSSEEWKPKQQSSGEKISLIVRISDSEM